MSNVSLKYNVWKEGAKRRSPNPKFTTVTQQNGPTSDPTFKFLVPSVLGGLPVAFVSVTGSANGHYVISHYPDPLYIPAPSDPPPTFTNPPPHADSITTVNVDPKSDLTISVWYLPLGGGPGTPEPAAYIDSFNVDTGQFFYDPNKPNDFVTVAPDSGLTTNANDLGIVPTKADEVITAQAQILGVPFLNWTVMGYSGQGFNPSVNGKALNVYANTWVGAVGFFGSQNKHKPLINFKDFYEATYHTLYPGEAVDAPKHGDPNPPQWRSAVKQLAVLLAMSESMGKVDAAHRAEIQTSISTLAKTLTEGLNKAAIGSKVLAGK